MEKKFFPIKQGVACQLKWTWNTIRLYQGTTASCHRVGHTKLDSTNFENFHNGQQFIDHRNMMLDGKFPQGGCSYCENIEKAGGVSDRLTHLKIPNLYPAELDIDPMAVHVTPRILEVFLDNICNMSCIYCEESYSSRIQQENLKFGRFKILNHDQHRLNKHPESDVLTEKFFDYLESNYHQLRKLNVLGGEPFFQPSFDRLLKVVKNNNNPNLELTIVTNLMVSRKKLETFVLDMKELLIQRKIGRLDITASLDCLGVEQEYIRYGIDLKKFKENFEFLVKHKWITLNVNSTITSLSVKTMPDMIRYIKSFLSDRKIFLTFGLVDAAAHLHPRIFGGKFFKKDFDLIISELSDITEWDKNQKEYMQGMANYVATCEVDVENIQQFEQYLNEIDRRRNLDWKKIFPWMHQHLVLLKESNVV